MNTYLLETSPFPGYFQAANNIVGEYHSHFVQNVQTISSSFLRYNKTTVALAAFSINFTLLYFADEITHYAAEKFRSEFFQKPWVETSSGYLFKTVFLFGGLTAFNYLVDLQLTRFQIVASIASTLFLQIFWQKVLSPTIRNYFDASECEVQLKRDETKIEEGPLERQRNEPGERPRVILVEPPRIEETTENDPIKINKADEAFLIRDKSPEPSDDQSLSTSSDGEEESEVDEDDLDESRVANGHSKLNTKVLQQDFEDLKDLEDSDD